MKVKLLGAIWTDPEGRTWKCVKLIRPNCYRAVSLDKSRVFETDARNLRLMIAGASPPRPKKNPPPSEWANT